MTKKFLLGNKSFVNVANESSFPTDLRSRGLKGSTFVNVTQKSLQCLFSAGGHGPKFRPSTDKP